METLKKFHALPDEGAKLFRQAERAATHKERCDLESFCMEEEESWVMVKLSYFYKQLFYS